jgi:hypothetical protein
MVSNPWLHMTQLCLGFPCAVLILRALAANRSFPGLVCAVSDPVQAGGLMAGAYHHAACACSGRHDLIATPAFAEKLAERLGAPCVLIDGAHFTPRE